MLGESWKKLLAFNEHSYLFLATGFTGTTFKKMLLHRTMTGETRMFLNEVFKESTLVE